MMRSWATLLALAPAVAQAESGMTLSGAMDLALERGNYDRGVSATRVQSGDLGVSRFNVRATEDLGEGVTAFAILETALGADTGTAGAGTALWNRGSVVGLRGPAGQVVAGRQYAPMFWVALRSDASTVAFPTTGVVLNIEQTLVTGRSGIGGFFNNAINYRTPDWHGWNGEVSYSVGNELAGPRRHDGENAGCNVQYGQDAWWAGYAYNRSVAHEATDTADRVHRTHLLGVKYSVAEWALGANVAYLANMLGGPSGGNAHVGQVSGRVAAGPGDVNLSIGWMAETGRKRTLAWHAGYVWPLSRRTQLYAFTVKLHNNAVGNRGLANLYGDYRLVQPGFDPQAVALGIRHLF
ncbi:hypothetical protein GCM10027277_45830 [Pseudoduganella ginsengisoli]|uniref:Porin n=1 Tax=Pseudoduganella ginsengisoli TaxID=1462440 RepID=A0A6L6Q892_9BURK|nr:porin [Pseudoduganella ginsengisoli]MTW05684.1 porin [Pseudoduganella ginsengisoli]